MADVAKLIDRIRAAGANVEMDAGKLRLVNSKKLPDGALAFIRNHGKEIAAYLESAGNIEERGAIIEIDGGASRNNADDLATILLASPPEDCNSADWTWFVSKAAAIIDARRR